MQAPTPSASCRRQGVLQPGWASALSRFPTLLPMHAAVQLLRHARPRRPGSQDCPLPTFDHAFMRCSENKGMHEFDAILYAAAGFIAAQFFTMLGVTAALNGFKIHHLYVGFIMMLAGFAARRKWLLYVGLGVALNDFVIEWASGSFTPRL